MSKLKTSGVVLSLSSPLLRCVHLGTRWRWSTKGHGIAWLHRLGGHLAHDMNKITKMSCCPSTGGVFPHNNLRIPPLEKRQDMLVPRFQEGIHSFLDHSSCRPTFGRECRVGLNAAKLMGLLGLGVGTGCQGWSKAARPSYPKILRNELFRAYNDLFRKRMGQESHSEWNQVAWHTSPGQPDSTWMLSETMRAYRC